MSELPRTSQKEVTDLADAAKRIKQNKARIKAKTQAFAREVKLLQLPQPGKTGR